MLRLRKINKERDFMCEIKIGESLKSVECFRVFPEYQTQDSQTKRNVLEKLKEWIISEEAQLDNIVENQDWR